MDSVGTTRLAKRRPPSGGEKRAKKKFAPSDQMHFSLSSPEGVRVRNTIQAVVRRLWKEYLGNTYVGNYCMCYVDRATKERTVYIVNIAGQGAGRCPNALHCECGLRTGGVQEARLPERVGGPPWAEEPHVRPHREENGGGGHVRVEVSINIDWHEPKAMHGHPPQQQVHHGRDEDIVPRQDAERRGKKAETTILNNRTGGGGMSSQAEMKRKRLDMIRKRRTCCRT